MPGRTSVPRQIVHLTREDPSFYASLGPFFGSREIAREVGSPIWDEPDKRWLLALRDGEVVGVCAYAIRPIATRLLSAYVRPEHRRQGVYTGLFEERLRLVDGDHLTATVTAASLGTFLRHGFEVGRQRGRFTHVTRA